MQMYTVPNLTTVLTVTTTHHTPVLTEGSTQYEPAMTPCIHNLQGNITQNSICAQQPTPAIDSARNVNLRLNPEFDLQSCGKWIVLYIMSKPLQFGVAVKYLSQPIWEALQDEENTLHFNDKAVVAKFCWQKKLAYSYCQNKEENSSASPSPFNLKQQSSLVKLLSSEKQLHPPARLALVSARAKNLSKQCMLLCAPPPSNSTKSQPQGLFAQSFLLSSHFQMSALGSGSVRNNQTPALRGCDFKSFYCPWAGLHFEHRYCALTHQVTWMIQETDEGHVKRLLPCVLTPSHGTCSHSPWPLQRVSVGKSCNSHAFEWSFVLEIPTKDQFTLSIAIHPLSADTLLVVIHQPVSGQFPYNNTAIVPCANTYSFTLETVPMQVKLFLTANSQTFCTLCLLMGTIEHDNINSFHNLSFCVSRPCYSTESASIPNLKCSVAHSPPQSGIDSSEAFFSKNLVPNLNKEKLQDTPPGKSYLQSKQTSTVFSRPMSMTSFLPRHSPLDLTTGVRTVSSPHSSDQKVSKKDGNGGGQDSSGNCSSSPGRSDGGGGANSNQPSNSGSGGRGDDGNKRNRKQDGEKEESDHQQEEKEVQEGMPSACKEDEWQLKQHTSHHLPSVHLLRGGSYRNQNTKARWTKDPLQRGLVGKSFNSHTFEWSFVLEIPTKDQFALSIAIHPLSADTLPTVGVDILQPVSGQFQYSNTAIASCVYTNSFALDIVPTQCKLHLTVHSQTFCTLRLSMGTIEHDNINSFHNLSFRVSCPCYSTASASIPNLKRSVAHSPSQSGSKASFTEDLIPENPQDARSDYASKSYLQSKQKSTIFPPQMSIRSFLSKHSPLDLTTGVWTVSSPHSSDQNDSKKDGNGGGQESSGNCSSSPGRSDGGGGANSNPPSNSGSGGRGDDDNKRNRKQDGEKEESGHQQEKKEVAEVQEGMPSACKEDEWQFKQHASHHQPSVYLAEGWFLQKPEHEGKVDKGLENHGTDTQHEDEEQNVPESTYGKDTAIEEEQSTLHAQNPSESLRFDECMQQPTSAIDSARSAIHSNLTLDLEFDLQSQDKWMVLCTKSLQFGVAVKNLSQNSLHSSDKPVVSNFFWQMSAFCQNREEEISIASPSPFSLKQQPSFIELLSSEEQLHPPARLALVSATAKNISNQRMLLLALPPSNSTKLHFPQPQELPTHSHTLGSGSVRNNQTPALRGYEFKPRYCPWVTLHFKHRYCALTLQVTWMIQETDGGHVKLLLSYMLTLHTPSHGTCSHSPWPLQRVSVGKSFNSHTFEWSFVLEILTKDQFALSIAIHPLSADTLPTVGVDIPQPVSGQFQYSNTAIASCVYTNSFALDIVPTQCKLLLTVHSQTFCTLRLPMGMIKHDNINSFHNLSFRVSHPCYSTASASIPNLKCSVAHSPQSGSKASFTEDFIPESPEDARSDYASKSYLQSKQKSTIFPPQMSMRSFLPRHSPLDLTTGVRTVSSPHSSDQNDSKKDGNGGGQENSGNCSSTPGRSDGGGGANSNPPSNSGSGGRGDDEDNKRNRKQDAEKEDSDLQQEKKELAEVQEGMPSACKEDEWQSKQHTSHHQPSVHLAEGWFLQKPEHEGKMDKGLDYHGTDTRHEDEEQNGPESTYGTKAAIKEEQSTLHEVQNSSKSLRLDKCMKGLSTSTVATKPLLSSTGHDYSIEQQEDDHSPGTTPNTEESVDDSVPNTKEHTTEHSPVLKGGSQDGYSEETRPSTVTQVSKHDSNQYPTLAETQSASCEAQAVDHLGSNKVSQSKNEGEINMVMMNTNVMPTTCQLPLLTTAEDTLSAPIKRFSYDYGNEIEEDKVDTEEDKVDGSQNIMPDFQHHLHGSVIPVQSEDTAHNASPGATAHVRPQMTSFLSVLECRLVPHVSHNNRCEPGVIIPTEEAPVMVSKQHSYINVRVCVCMALMCLSYF